MSTLREYHDLERATADLQLLERRGVPCYLKDAGRPGSGDAWMLVLVFAKQRQDALALLQDEAHQVRVTVDMTVYREAADPDESLKWMSDLMAWIAIGLFALFFGIFLLDSYDLL
jgi:hypothetical protein